MRIAVSGTTGLVGSRLVERLTADGHEIIRFVRTVSDKADEVYWSWQDAEIATERLEGIDCCIHLAGENITSGRWSAARKKLIADSRIRGTALISETLCRLKNPPKSFLCASAIGFYGNRAEEILNENSANGRGYLSETCTAWEEATAIAAKNQIRTLNLRIGVVLDRKGGALAKMLPSFRICLGGPIADGKQYISWISEKDLSDAIVHCIHTEQLSGPVNLTSPTPVTNAEFSQTLAQALRRPAIFRLPGFAARLLLGEMADELLLASTRVIPEKLQASGFCFTHRTLESALADVL